MSNCLPSKPRFGEPCNGCGYCCTAAPCELAQEFLNCSTGPCVSLEHLQGRTFCGLVRNPLGYLFKAAQPASSFDVLAPAPALEAGRRLSLNLATALGVGMGCDALDDGATEVAA